MLGCEVRDTGRFTRCGQRETESFSREPRESVGSSLGYPKCFSPLQAGMPRTLSATDMVTPGSLSPPPTESTEGEQAGQPLLDGAPSSASLDTLIQHLVPTADYYPEVGELPWGGVAGESMGQLVGLGMALCGRGVGAGC